MPVLLPVYWASLDAPDSAYFCRSEERCPGLVEPRRLTDESFLCREHAIGINCGQCEDGYYRIGGTNGACEKCNPGTAVAFFAVFQLVVIGLVVLVYRMANSPMTIEMNPLLTFTISLGVIFNLFQNLGILGSMALSFPWATSTIMYLLLDCFIRLYIGFYVKRCV